MAHECDHCSDTTLETVRAEQTVGEVARGRAGALEAMKTLGINHCCGAHLTLREAAASAGVPLDALLEALNAPGDRGQPPAVPAATGAHRVLDVRGLDPPQPMVRVLEELDRLGPGTVLEVHHDRRPMFLYPQLEARGFVHETDQPEPGLVRIVIRSTGS